METEIPQAESAIVLHNEKQADRKIQTYNKSALQALCPTLQGMATAGYFCQSAFFLFPIGTDRIKKLRWQLFPAYIRHGFRQAMDLLGEWFDKHDTGLIIHYPLVPQAEQVLEAQRAYCNKIHLQHTPFITINEKEKCPESTL